MIDFFILLISWTNKYIAELSLAGLDYVGISKPSILESSLKDKEELVVKLKRLINYPDCEVGTCFDDAQRLRPYLPIAVTSQIPAEIIVLPNRKQVG